jgi:nucleoid-associated protein YgaU
VRDGTIAYSESVLQEGERLDTIAGKVYGDGRYWWVIAAASGIGWGIQVPPGTVIIIPDINQVAEYVG